MEGKNLRPMTLAVRSIFAASVMLVSLAGCNGSGNDAPVATPAAAGDINKVQNVVVIYLENRSFDNLFGNFPGANGIGNVTAANAQVDFDGKTVLTTLPAVWGSETDPSLGKVSTLPNAPFRLDAAPVNSTMSVVGPDLVHRFYQNQMQINGGANNMFAAYSNRGGYVMGYYDGSGLNLYKLAQQYTLADNFFQGAFGGSFLNHQYLVCACAPTYPNAPASEIATVDATGKALTIDPTSPTNANKGAVKFVHDGSVTPDGYAVNTILPPYQPSAAPSAPGQDVRLANPAGDAYEGSAVLPPIDSTKFTTIGDTLTAAGVNWKWYAGQWNNALVEGLTVRDSKNYKLIWTENPGQPDFEPHHQPFNYYTRFDPTTAQGQAERANHLQDATNMLADAANGTLPAVSFYKPAGNVNGHPGYSDVQDADVDLANVLSALQKSPQWGHMAIVVTTDEFGGFYDHVAPPAGDRWGPGSRIPAVVISPYAKKGYVDHTYYDTASILKFITKRFNLKPLAGFRSATGDLTNAFDFTQAP